MSKESSVYLDLVRFTAALIVMLSHLGGQRWTGGLGWQFVPFGGPAVDVFFVLSGYVIAYTVAGRERDLSSYAVSRAGRVYSVVVPVLLLTAAMGAVGSWLRPAFDWGDRSFAAYGVSLIFANQLWFMKVSPGNLGPFWSLCYEVWFYILFACAVLLRGSQRIWLLAICLGICGPRIALMLPVWLLGAAGYRLTRIVSSQRVVQGLLLWAASTLVMAVLAIWQSWYSLVCGSDCYLLAAAGRPLGDWTEYAVDYGIGLLFACNLVGFALSAPYWAAPMAALRRPVKWIAGATFTLYLLHYPLAQFLVAVSPWPLGSARQQAFVYLPTIALVFLVAQFTERKKTIWKSGFQRLADALPAVRTPPETPPVGRPSDIG